MTPQSLHDELKIREKIQGLKTPVQDADWQDMLALLESQDIQGGPLVPDPLPPGAALTAGRLHRLLPVLLGLLVAGAWWLSRQGSPASKEGNETGNKAIVEQTTGGRTPMMPVTGTDTTRTNRVLYEATPDQDGPRVVSQPDPALVTLENAAPRGRRSALVPAATQKVQFVGTPGYSKNGSSITTGGRQTNATRYYTDGLATQRPAAQAPAGASNNTPMSGESNHQAGTEEINTNALKLPQLFETTDGKQEGSAPATDLQAPIEGRERNLAVLLRLPPIESPLTQPLKSPNPLPDPIVRLFRDPRRFQRGLILGLNANIVNYDALRLSVMPQVGYHISMPLTKRYRFQAECQLKYVTNYQEHTEFVYIVPGNSLEIKWDMNNLFFVELPLLLKKENPGVGGATWLTGLKPAFCAPVFSGGAYSVSTSSSLPAPQTDFDLRDGVRWIDLGVVLGMEWRFARQWALDVRYNQGLFDLTHDNFFKNTTTHLNTDVQFTLRHYVQPYKNNRYAKNTFPGGPHRPDRQRGLQKRR